MRPLCFIFLESSMKTTDTWYRNPLRERDRGGRGGVCVWGGGSALQENAMLSVNNTHTHRGEYYRQTRTLGREVCEADVQTLSSTKGGRERGEL